jgi:hypothetical protein
LHHWHHARDRDAGNYGNVCPLMDVLFGTHVCPDREPESFGLNQPTPKTWLGHMVRPLLPKRRKAAAGVESPARTEVESAEWQPTGANDEPDHDHRRSRPRSTQEREYDDHGARR